jgi:hypothetical protein
MAMLSIHAGYDIAYLTDAVGKGGADYYLSAAGPGSEPPGFWIGKGAQALGLTGEVDPKVMRALYHHDIGPDGSPLETPGGRRTYDRQRETIDDHIEATVAAKVAELGAFPTGREVREIQLMARAEQRSSVPFFDHTLSLEKSVSVTHASYLAAAKQAREDGDQAEPSGARRRRTRSSRRCAKVPGRWCGWPSSGPPTSGPATTAAARASGGTRRA